MKINWNLVDTLLDVVIYVALIVLMLVAANAGHWTEAIFWLLLFAFGALDKRLKQILEKS